MTHLPLDQVCAEHCMPSEFSQVKGLLNPLIYIYIYTFHVRHFAGEIL